MIDESHNNTSSDAYNTSSTNISVTENTLSDPSNSSWTANYDAVCNPTYNTTEDFLSSLMFHFIIYIMYGIVFILALCGNGLVCFIVQTSPRMKTVTNYFIVNLAVGDMMLTLFCVPFSFVSMLVLRYWPFGAVMCKVVNYSQAVSVLVSAYTLLAISIDRYMAIMHPLKPRLGTTAAKTVVAGVWLGALATAAPIALVSRLKRPTEWHQYCEADVCLEQWKRPEQSEQYTLALLALQFALPLSVLVCTYARIAHVVWGGRPPGEAHGDRDSRMQRSKRKMVKMMVTVVAVFTVCWLPLNVFIVLWTVHENDEEWSQWWGMPYVWFASHWLAMSHSCYNPVIYCYMNVRYRRGFQQVMSCIIRARSDTPSQHRSSGGEGLPMSDDRCGWHRASWYFDQFSESAEPHPNVFIMHLRAPPSRKRPCYVTSITCTRPSFVSPTTLQLNKLTWLLQNSVHVSWRLQHIYTLRLGL